MTAKYESKAFGSMACPAAIRHVGELIGSPEEPSFFAELAQRMLDQKPFRWDCDEPPHGEGRALVLTTARQAVPYGAALQGFWDTYNAEHGSTETPLLGYIDPVAKHLRKVGMSPLMAEKHEAEEIERVRGILETSEPISIVYVFDEHVVQGRSIMTAVRMVQAAGAARVSRSPLFPASWDAGYHIRSGELPLLREVSDDTYALCENPDTEAVANLLQDMRSIGSIAAQNYMEFATQQ